MCSTNLLVYVLHQPTSESDWTCHGCLTGRGALKLLPHDLPQNDLPQNDFPPMNLFFFYFYFYFSFSPTFLLLAGGFVARPQNLLTSLSATPNLLVGSRLHLKALCVPTNLCDAQPTSLSARRPTY